jgi:hypothetical protein
VADVMAAMPRILLHEEVDGDRPPLRVRRGAIELFGPQ